MSSKIRNAVDDYLRNGNGYSNLIFLARDKNTSPEDLRELFRTNSNRIHHALATNPSTPSSVLDELIKYGLEYDVSKNPNTSSKTLRKLSTYSNQSLVKQVALNKNTPVDVFERLSKSSDPSIRYCVASNPNCPSYILIDFYLNSLDIFNSAEFYISAFEKHPNGRYIVKLMNDSSMTKDELNTYLSLLELGCDIKSIDKNKEVFYYIFFDLLLHKNIDKLKVTKEMKDVISKKIMDPSFPEEILYYYYLNPSIHYYFSNEALSKIFMIGKKSQRTLTNGVKYKDYYLLKTKCTFVGVVKGQKPENQSNIPYKIDDYNIKKAESGFEFEMVSYSNDVNYYKDKESTNFGFYPQVEVTQMEKVLLDYLYENKALMVLEKTYTLADKRKDKKYNVYYLNNREFIRFNNTWVEVLPVNWSISKEMSNITYSYNFIFTTTNSIIPNIPKKNNHIKQLFWNDIFMSFNKDKNYENDCLEQLNQLEKEENELKRLEGIINKEKEEKKEEKEKIEKNKLIESIYLEKLERMKKIEELRNKRRELQNIVGVDKKEELGKLNVNEIIYTRDTVNIDPSVVFKQVEDHMEINSLFLPYLKYLKLSNRMPENLKVSGLDLSETDLVIDPQKVYKKDLSNTKLSTLNLSQMTLDFEGCNLCGADLSKVSFSINYYGNIEEAVIDDKTILPEGYGSLDSKL